MARAKASGKAGRKFKTLQPQGITKWTKGMLVEGTIVEIRNSPNTRFEGKGHILDLDTANGKISYGCPTILYNYLHQVDVGDAVRIECLGKVKVPRGKAWDFKVDVEIFDDDEDTSEDKE